MPVEGVPNPTTSSFIHGNHGLRYISEQSQHELGISPIINKVKSELDRMKRKGWDGRGNITEG